jgi:23S rRNA (pseudouridine1915-N3)-methyltransferase
MRIVIVAVGRVKDPPLRAALDAYLGRIRRSVPCDEIELPDGPPSKLSAAFAKATVEATALALEVTGQAVGSSAFARKLEQAAGRNKGIVAYLLGGADGLPRAVSDGAHERLCLSALTFPHRLARVVLVEQIYRAVTILRGEPYAH